MSGPRFVLTTEAGEDVLQIWEYIAEDSIDAADQIINRLYDAFVRLAHEPGMGHHRKDLADCRHRFWNVYSYVIVYRWDTSPLQIIAVVHGARHLDALLQDRIPSRQAE